MNGASLFGRGRLAGRFGLRMALWLLSFVGICAVAPQLVVAFAPGSPSPTDCALRAEDGSYQDRLAPNANHWFGTDRQGCDEFSRVIYGARHSLIVGVGAAVLIALVGMSVGVAAGWRGGWVDAIVRRTGDVVLGIPLVVGMILILAVLVPGQRSATTTVVAFTVLLWPTVARISRAATRSIRTESYIEAARAVGATDVRICLRHVVPNALPPVAAYTASLVGLLIGAEAVLSYLGFAVAGSVVSWGQMMDDAQTYYSRSPHLLILPSVFLSAAVAGFLLLGDAIAQGPAGREIDAS
ncbi:MAG: ABC transporter permease [Actinomycetia bacterium]|nr:ABC transporter permease [Actinomycetes bacterium]